MSDDTDHVDMYCGLNIERLLNGGSFEFIKFLNPIASITLYAMAFTRGNRQQQPTRIMFADKMVNGYASKMGIITALNDQTDVYELPEFDPSAIKAVSSYLRLSRIDCNDRERTSASSRAIMMKLIEEEPDRDKLSCLERAISESLQNVFDHNDYKNAVITFQRAVTSANYPEFPNHRRQTANRFTLYSPGTTLQQSLLRSRPVEKVSHSDAAYLSVLPGFSRANVGESTDGPNAGLGLFLMMRFGARLGRFTLISGDACLKAEATTIPEVTRLNSEVDGVIISIEALDHLATDKGTQDLSVEIASECKKFFDDEIQPLKKDALAEMAKSAPRLLENYLGKERIRFPLGLLC